MIEIRVFLSNYVTVDSHLAGLASRSLFIILIVTFGRLFYNATLCKAVLIEGFFPSINYLLNALKKVKCIRNLRDTTINSDSSQHALYKFLSVFLLKALNQSRTQWLQARSINLVFLASHSRSLLRNIMHYTSVICQ